MKWEEILKNKYQQKSGATIEEIEHLTKYWNADLSPKEIEDINSRQKNPFHEGDKYYNLYKPFDPSLWKFPRRKLPSSYIDFLKYSNGGEFGNEDRYFQFFNTNNFREMNILYELPEYMQDAVSFAMDGCGNHLVFDMRKEQSSNEYPILATHSGNLGYEDCKLIAYSFEELCKGTTSIDDEMNAEYESTRKSFPETIDIYLVSTPKSGKKALLYIKQKLNLNISIRELSEAPRSIPFKLLENVKFAKYYKECFEVNNVEECLELKEIYTNKILDLKEWI